MKRRELKTCVEFIGQDDTLDAEQREALWMELRPVKPLVLVQMLLFNDYSMFSFHTTTIILGV